MFENHFAESVDLWLWTCNSPIVSIDDDDESLNAGKGWLGRFLPNTSLKLLSASHYFLHAQLLLSTSTWNQGHNFAQQTYHSTASSDV